MHDCVYLCVASLTNTTSPLAHACKPVSSLPHHVQTSLESGKVGNLQAKGSKRGPQTDSSRTTQASLVGFGLTAKWVSYLAGAKRTP